MKYFNHKIIGIAMMCATVMACTDKYDCLYERTSK